MWFIYLCLFFEAIMNQQLKLLKTDLSASTLLATLSVSAPNISDCEFGRGGKWTSSEVLISW